MSSKVPRVTGEEAVRAFCKDGYVIVRTSGSHRYLRHPKRPIALSIPVHKGKTLKVGLLASKIKDSGMTVEQFIALL
jgi:predicted RNA binding protein YcfA (HicA-like mRNA interferase family)